MLAFRRRNLCLLYRKNNHIRTELQVFIFLCMANNEKEYCYIERECFQRRDKVCNLKLNFIKLTSLQLIPRQLDPVNSAHDNSLSANVSPYDIWSLWHIIPAQQLAPWNLVRTSTRPTTTGPYNNAPTKTGFYHNSPQITGPHYNPLTKTGPYDNSFPWKLVFFLQKLAPWQLDSTKSRSSTTSPYEN